MMLAHVTYGDRALFGALIGAERAEDSVAMVKILFGDDFVDRNTVLYGVSNTNAPLVMDDAMSGSLKVYARNNQAVACTPWMITGAMSPCTEAGTLAQLLAEALATCALTQLIRPGAPCLMGSFATAMSMQSGAPTFGMPEAAKTVLAAGQLARRLGVPFHTVGSLTSSKVPDSQAQQEGSMSLIMAVLAGANFINHATGWLEGGLCTRENHHRRRSLRQADRVLQGHRPVRQCTGDGGYRRSRSRQPFPVERAYAEQFRIRLLPLQHRRPKSVPAAISCRARIR
jgi:trimethylamine--corrinoid protein Co-methyltransferase